VTGKHENVDSPEKQENNRSAKCLDLVGKSFKFKTSGRQTKPLQSEQARTQGGCRGCIPPTRPKEVLT